MNIIIFLINRGYSVFFSFKISEKVWSVKEVNFFYFKVFRCVVYFYVNFKIRDKFDVKGIKYYFIGYGSD